MNFKSIFSKLSFNKSKEPPKVTTDYGLDNLIMDSQNGVQRYNKQGVNTSSMWYHANSSVTGLTAASALLHTIPVLTGNQYNHYSSGSVGQQQSPLKNPDKSIQVKVQPKLRIDADGLDLIAGSDVAINLAANKIEIIFGSGFLNQEMEKEIAEIKDWMEENVTGYYYISFNHDPLVIRFEKAIDLVHFKLRF